MININILKNAIETWGDDVQIDMMIEECAELIVALQKSKRHYDTTSQKQDILSNIIDEVADVTIMMKQAEIIFGKKIIEERINFKMERLSNRLKK